MTCRRPFLTSDLYLNEEIQQLLPHIIYLGQVQKVIQEYGNNILPSPSETQLDAPIQPRDNVLLKTWKEECPENQINFNTNGGGPC